MARKPTKKHRIRAVRRHLRGRQPALQSPRSGRHPLVAWTVTNRPATIIEQQDREIAEKSGQIPLQIKSIQRAGAKIPEKERKRR